MRPSSTAEPLKLSDAQRTRFAGFADHLISGGAGLPSATQADVHGPWIDRAFGARPDLVSVVLDIIDRDGTPAAVLDTLYTADRPAFDAFAFAVSGAYLMNPRVRQGLGLPGSAPEKNPAFPDEADSYLEDGILDPVVQRGPIYRPTPNGTAA